MSGRSVLWTAVVEAAGHDPDELHRWLEVLQTHGMVSSWFDDDVGDLLVETEDVDDFNILTEMGKFARKTRIPLTRILCDLDFSVFDDMSLV